jgi:uncharacterized protein with ATP-grasp and redox domains
MHTTLDCIPCLLRQTLETARLATPDAATHETIFRKVLGLFTRVDVRQPPPVMARKIYDLIQEITGVNDPYGPIKERFNQMALELLPELKATVNRAADPFAMAVRMAIAGNIIDFGANGGLTEEDVRTAVANVLSEPFVGDLPAFQRAIGKATHIMYLADNAGEIVFDRLLIEQLHGKHVTLAVRGRAIINDALLADAARAGLDNLCDVIDNGSGVPGTVLDTCDQRFRERFTAADLIIAKGQGNYETLSDAPGDIYFLLKVKCPVIASHIGLGMGTQALVYRAPSTIKKSTSFA